MHRKGSNGVLTFGNVQSTVFVFTSANQSYIQKPSHVASINAWETCNAQSQVWRCETMQSFYHQCIYHKSACMHSGVNVSHFVQWYFQVCFNRKKEGLTGWKLVLRTRQGWHSQGWRKRCPAHQNKGEKCASLSESVTLSGALSWLKPTTINKRDTMLQQMV